MAYVPADIRTQYLRENALRDALINFTIRIVLTAGKTKNVARVCRKSY
jgi:hypothetical protein